MTLHFDVFWSFRSPYSYFATPRLLRIAKKYDVDVGVRIVLPIAVRLPGFFDEVDPLWMPYFVRDSIRVAEKEGLPYVWPSPDPIVQDFASRKVAEEQPYIGRLSRLGVAAVEQGRGLPFIHRVSSLIFGGTPDWHEGDHLARATRKAGLDLEVLEAEIEANPEHYDAVLEQNGKDLAGAGHWGVPTMVFEGEPFFGQDRLDLLLWRMEQHGLARRKKKKRAGKRRKKDRK